MARYANGKEGRITFKIKDSVSGNYFYVKNEDFLTPFQEKQMSFQPDFILEYAQHLESHYKDKGHQNIQVFADSFVALNGRPSQRFIDPNFDLLQQKSRLVLKNGFYHLMMKLKVFKLFLFFFCFTFFSKFSECCCNSR